MNSFNPRDSLASKSNRTIAEYLRLIGDDDAALRFSDTGVAGQGLNRFLGCQDQYAYSGILMGFIPSGSKGKALQIQSAFELDPDMDLKGARIKITLDKFYVANFPGTGTHSILCEFTGKNQLSEAAEEMRFAVSTTANDRSSAAISGAPIFLGVSVGQDGIAFEGRTVNVASSDDTLLMDALGSDAFRNGLALLTSAQPALKPFVGLAGSVVKAIAGRNKNRQIYAFKLGLDFAGGATSARLREGSYIVVQADDSVFNWSAHTWNSDARSVVETATGKPIDFNYMVFGVSRFSA